MRARLGLAARLRLDTFASRAAPRAPPAMDLKFIVYLNSKVLIFPSSSIGSVKEY